MTPLGEGRDSTFAEHAGRHLVHGDQADPGRIAEAVFGDAYPCGIPVDEYARRSLSQARRAVARDARRIIANVRWGSAHVE